MVKERQVSFAGGELSPSLWGRTDLNRYLVGARTIRNFVVTPHGVLMNRSGTQHLGGVSLDDGGEAVLFPFVYSETDTLILLFTKNSMVWYTDSYLLDGVVLPGTIGMAPFSPDTDQDIETYRFAQIGNQIVHVGEGMDPILWTRDPDTDAFSFETLDFQVPLYPSWLDNPAMEVKPSADQLSDAGLSWSDAAYEALSGHPIKAMEGDASHPTREWVWAVTRVMQTIETGEVWESAPYVVRLARFRFLAQGYDPDGVTVGGSDWNYSAGGAWNYTAVNQSVAVYPDWTVRLELFQGSGANLDDSPENIALGDQYNLLATRIYRGREGRFGFVGETKDSDFVDDGAVPDFSTPPPQGRNPFRNKIVGNLYDIERQLASASYELERPRTVTYYENRRFFAGLVGDNSERPSLVLGSATEDFLNYDEIIPANDTAALEFTLASNKQETVYSVLPLQRLLILTDSAEWLVGGSGLSEVITPNSIAARRASQYGCAAYPAPEVVGDTVFFPQRKGVRPRALRLTGDGAESQDVSLLSRHLFEGYTIRAWAYAEDPHQILWVVRSDGALLSLTYVPEQQMLAWARHDIGGSGAVEAVAVKPEGAEDGVYLLVNRGGVRSLERMLPRVSSDIRDGMFLDRASIFDGRRSSDDTDRNLYITDLGGSNGAMGEVVNLNFTGTDGATFPEPRFVGLWIKITQEGVEYFLRIDSDQGFGGGVWLFRATVMEPRDFSDDMDTAINDGNTGLILTGDDWELMDNTARGLAHLDGQEVSIFADGDVITERTVKGGAVYLGNEVEEIDRWASVIYAGLPITAQFESLDAVQERGKQKIIEEVVIELERARGGHVGPTLDNLVELRQRKVSDAYDPIALQREEARVPVPDRWAETGRVALQHTDPLPMTILGITRSIKHGG